jgi:hypothetical protein
LNWTSLEDCCVQRQWLKHVKRGVCTPSVSDLEVVLDKVCVKHWEYKSSITFKLLSLQI